MHVQHYNYSPITDHHFCYYRKGHFEEFSCSFCIFLLTFFLSNSITGSYAIYVTLDYLPTLN